LPECRFSPILKDVEVRLTPETEKKLKDLSTQSGRGTDELVEDAMVGYFHEVLEVREMLNSRYENLKSGKVKLIPGDEVEAYFREKSASARRSDPQGS
jgi:predicted DNA-binding protein